MGGVLEVKHEEEQDSAQKERGGEVLGAEVQDEAQEVVGVEVQGAEEQSGAQEGCDKKVHGEEVGGVQEGYKREAHAEEGADDGGKGSRLLSRQYSTDKKLNYVLRLYIYGVSQFFCSLCLQVCNSKVK